MGILQVGYNDKITTAQNFQKNDLLNGFSSFVEVLAELLLKDTNYIFYIPTSNEGWLLG